ncbi:LysR substrate-binding domain-containing protein [Allokutzneria sp. A3M-2-11 16]|uniref:LysR substrate-binding domain-containing protein n=1 Tax=Allokutzneria sp. A3M-2-11 16 TaxID=2962043 RepID=UPI00273A647F|nr:LysR substrate-binding domain-containing protein [Allokutzneria sp. A3M-2-11 16]
MKRNGERPSAGSPSPPSRPSRGEIDLAVVHDWQNTPLAVPDGLSRARIGEDAADVLLPQGHPLAERDVLVPGDLANQRWICQEAGAICHDWLVRTLRDAQVEPDVAHVALRAHWDGRDSADGE